MRGTPHVHSLVWIGNDGITEESVNSEDIAEQQKVKKLMKKTVSAILVDEVDTLDEVEIEPKKQENIKEEKKYHWNPYRDYHEDKNHPCRLPFNSSWDYGKNEDGTFSDINVQRQYRGLQIGNQFHDCCSTCYKYCQDQERTCRFGFPKPSDDTLLAPCIRKERDKKNRIRINVLPQTLN
jgi:hypothetical protein